MKKRDDDEYGIWEQGPYDEYGICVPEPYGADLYGAYVQYAQYKATVLISGTTILVSPVFFPSCFAKDVEGKVLAKL